MRIPKAPTWLAIVLAGCFSGGAAAFALQASAGELFKKGFLEFQARNLRSAEELFRQAHALEPDNAEINMLLALTLDQQKRHREATPFHEKAASLRPRDPRILTNLGLNLFQQKRLPEAIAALSRSVAIQPEQFGAQYILGLGRLQMGDAPGALPHLEAAEKLQPGNAQVAAALQQARRGATKTTPGKDQAKTIPLDADPQQAAQLLRRGKYAEALPLLEELRRREPESAAIAYDLALTYYRLERYHDAQRVLESLKQPGAEGYALLAEVYRAVGMFPEAVDTLKKASAAAPDNADYLYDLTVLLMGLDKAKEAERLLEDAVQRFPRAGKIHAARGIALFMAGRNDEAIRAYEEAIRLEPKAADFHAALGDVLTSTGELARAETAYAEAIRLDPRTAEYHVKAGKNLLKLQKNAEAEAAFHAALLRDPQSSEANFQIGKLAAARGDHAAAIRHLEAAVARDGGAAEAWYQLSLSYQRAGQRDKAAAALKRFRELRAEEKK
jgi:tetratricopeptide (TPR) repeat protein